ncbi:hypothetical protein DINM_004571 [Dirofilaria immitis]|nr:hypothetical protein [Dirofilaria immitis]
MTVLPIVLFVDFRAEQEKGPLKIIDSSDDPMYHVNLTTSLSSTTPFQKHFIDSLLSEKVLATLITQLFLYFMESHENSVLSGFYLVHTKANAQNDDEALEQFKQTIIKKEEDTKSIDRGRNQKSD